MVHILCRVRIPHVLPNGPGRVHEMTARPSYLEGNFSPVLGRICELEHGLGLHVA